MSRQEGVHAGLCSSGQPASFPRVTHALGLQPAPLTRKPEARNGITRAHAATGPAPEGPLGVRHHQYQLLSLQRRKARAGVAEA